MKNQYHRNFHLSALEFIGYEKIYEAYCTGLENILRIKKRQRAFQKIWSAIIAIPRWQAQIQTKMSEHLDHHNRWNETRNDTLGEFYKILEPMLFAVNGRPIERELGEYYHALDQIQIAYQGIPNFRNPTIIQEHLVTKTLELNRRSRNIPNIHTLNPHLLKASLAFENMEIGLTNTAKAAMHYYSLFKGYSRVISLCRKILS